MLSALRIAVVFAALAAPALAEGFVRGIDDLPLMEGLTDVQGAGTVFDSASGRIVETFAAGPVDAASVATFYADTLPQLGWRAEGPGAYVREDEHLTITTTENAAGLTVRFSLTPETE
ncbi:MAG: hypothetical protein FJX36_04230 [Alphaproteobacteria bacterium]|nr:hypothetical protein [Alphaproteobacteria bacterium]